MKFLTVLFALFFTGLVQANVPSFDDYQSAHQAEVEQQVAEQELQQTIDVLNAHNMAIDDEVIADANSIQELEQMLNDSQSFSGDMFAEHDLADSLYGDSLDEFAELDSHLEGGVCTCGKCDGSGLCK